MSSPIVVKVCRNLKEGLHFIAENQMFLEINFSQALIVVGFFID